ncbi:myelin transcription factor 1-like protein [Ostrea edulis]|uniref:myelin transcription factor 1-like protein n=1 Tax=Ostrea edulis TaxID=37623 RepID=UPI00209457F6|nr:myelin transcription factor 1-like protein [Ostrea edulis]
MLRIVTFVAILIAVNAGASSSERAKLLEDPKGTQINTKDLFLKQEKERAVNGNENLSLVDLSKKAAEGFEGIQDEFDEENEIDPDDIQDESDVENDSDSDDFEDEPGEEGDDDSDDSDDIQDNSNEEDDGESESFQNDFETEHVVGNSLESSLSQLNDMIKKANPGSPEEASKRSFEDKDMIDGDIKLDEESAAELVDFYKRNPQYLSLDSNVTSASVGIALHEIGHALGFYHEQSRPDRGKYVIIKKGNIRLGKKRNFFIRPSRTYGTNYDYGSIMHYSEEAFAKKSGLRTIIAKQRHYGRTMGQRIGLSFDDIKAANFHYCQSMPNIQNTLHRETLRHVEIGIDMRHRVINHWSHLGIPLPDIHQQQSVHGESG